MKTLAVGLKGWLQMSGKSRARIQKVDGVLTLVAGALIVLGLLMTDL